jgi:hypothetical protein
MSTHSNESGPLKKIDGLPFFFGRIIGPDRFLFLWLPGFVVQYLFFPWELPKWEPAEAIMSDSVFARKGTRPWGVGLETMAPSILPAFSKWDKIAVTTPPSVPLCLMAGSAARVTLKLITCPRGCSH